MHSIAILLFTFFSINTHAQDVRPATKLAYDSEVVAKAVSVTDDGSCLLLEDNTAKCLNESEFHPDFKAFLEKNKIKQLSIWRDSQAQDRDDYISRYHVLALSESGELVSNTTAETKNSKLGPSFIIWEKNVDKVIETTASRRRGLVVLKTNTALESMPALFSISDWNRKAPAFVIDVTPKNLNVQAVSNLVSHRVAHTTPGRWQTGYFQVFTDGNILECVWCGDKKKNVIVTLPERIEERGKISAFFGDFFIVDSMNNLREVFPQNPHQTNLNGFKKLYNGRLKFVFDSGTIDGGFVVFITKDGDYHVHDEAGFGDMQYKFSSEPMYVSRKCAILKNNSVECVL